MDMSLTRKRPPDSEPGSADALGPRPLSTLLAISLLWMLVYLVLQGQDGFFARTADAVNTQWVRVTVLNVPLHLALTVVMLLCAASRRRRALRAGVVVGAVNVALIAAHVVLSIVTA